MTYRGWRSIPSLAGLVLLGGSLAGEALAAEAGDDFYKGKQITLVTTADAGSVYVTYARLLAQHLPDHLAGRPTMIVQMMPGASGLTGAYYLYNAAPRDGTVIGAVNANIPTAPLLNRDEAKFDVNKYSWLGSISRDPFVGFVWHTAPIKTLDEAKRTEVILGGQALGAASVDMAVLGKELFDLKIKIVTGYKSSGETKLALEKGEIQGVFGNLWTSLKTEKPDWIADQKIRIVTQFGFSKHPDLPDVPLFMDLATKPEDRQLLELLLSRQEFAKPFVAPPEVPPARLDMLRRAFDATLKDPKFLEDADKLKLPIDRPMTGEELATTTEALSRTPASAIKRLEDIFAGFRAGK
jgi:tripartite-type tricarboxylate transporter receptor subunit TctC